jgi:hypothetical protein
MEVMQVSRETRRAQALRLLTGEGVAPDRRELYERVLDRRTREGFGVGIAGAEVCQRCASLEAFAGLAAAMLKHRRGGYVCSACLRELSGASAGAYGSAELSRIEHELSMRPLRFCEVCTGEVVASTARRIGQRALLCAECHAEFEQRARDLDDLLRDLSRLRYSSSGTRRIPRSLSTTVSTRGSAICSMPAGASDRSALNTRRQAPQRRRS